MRRRRLVVVATLVALVAGLALWLRREQPPGTAVERRGPVRDRALAPARMRAPARPPPALAWLWQKGLAQRRVAGRVMHAGRPVAGAVVRLATEELRIGEWVLAEVETDGAGRFDFGPRPPTRYRVVAQAKGLVAGGVLLELRAREPRPAPGDVTIELRDCELLISGTVRDAAGGVIAGARVRAGTRAEVFGGVLSDEQGNYEVCLQAGPAHVEAAADGYGTALEHTGGRSAARVDFALSPEVAIVGRVVDGAGAPVGGAAVIAETNGHDPGQLTESADDGGFRLDGLIAGTYRVVARDADRADDETVTLAAAGASAEVTLTLQQGATLSGRVVVAGQPRGDATVIARAADETWMLGSAVTQTDGRFAIDGLPRGQVHIEVEGHKLLSPAPIVDLGEVERGQVELVCERLATVSGRVVRGGKTVARAHVMLEQNLERRSLALSNDDGTFELEGVEPATYDIRATSAAEGAATARRAITVGAKDVAGLLLELDLSASIAGSVVDAKGAAVGGVRVYLEREGDDAVPDDVFSDRTAADGTFLISALAAGSYRPHVSRDRDGAILRPPVGGRHPAIAVADATSRVTGVRLTIAPADLTISGRAVRRGEPVAGIEIAAVSRLGDVETARSEADGTFVLEGLVEGRYELQARQVGQTEISVGDGRTLSVDAGATKVVVELPATGKIEGVLRGFSAPPEITVRGDSGGRKADVSGSRFAVADVPVGEYVVSAVAASGHVASARVNVTADQVGHVTLTASATGTLTGTVVDLRTGAAVPGTFCRWEAGDGSLTRPVATDASGRFSFAVPAGTVRVDCFGRRPQLIVVRDVSANVEPGGIAHVTVEAATLHRSRQDGTIGVELEQDASGAHRVHFLLGAAASSGLRVGDVLLAVDGLPVAGMRGYAVRLLMLDRSVGATAKLIVDREGTQRVFDVAVEPAPVRPEEEDPG